MIGKTISHYKLLEKVGHGGMGEVYKAQNEKLPRFVALKLLSHNLADKQEEKQRFIHEAKAASALDHQNICTIYEIGDTEEGQMFIVMAYYDGGSLSEKIKRRGPLSIPAAVDIAAQIALGLANAHAKDITHRDIKPANTMFNSEGVVKIVDFGLAKLAGASRVTKTGVTVGTPAYMSPEQARMLEVDHRTDIWSLGVVLYEMLTARLPFHGDQALALMYAIAMEPHDPIQNYLPDIPAPLLHIVNRALMKSPDDRYPTMNDMLEDLRKAAKTPMTESAGKATLAKPAEPGTIPPVRCEDRAILFSDEALRLVRDLRTFAEKLQYLTNLILAEEDHAEPPAGSNPYLNRLMIQNPQDFYGRAAELRRIYERIKAGRPQSISLVGVRRIGKSSLLKAIHHPRHRKQYLPAPEDYVFVFMDLQEKRNVQLADLFQYIFNALQKEYRGYLKLNARPDYDGLKEIVHTFQEAGLKLIFLWDEFESVTRNPQFGPEFYAYFRALANNYNVAYITTSSALLQSLCHTKEIADSPFFNIFTNLHLGPFKPDEARRLIAEPSAKAGKPLAAHTDFILEIAGLSPFFIQIACAALFSLERADKTEHKKAKEIFMEEAKPHFQEFWERFDESQRAVVLALAKGKKPPREHAFAVKDLAQAGLVRNGNKLFSTLFADFVKEIMHVKMPWWKIL
jgi:serine/threonine protein kinase